MAVAEHFAARSAWFVEYEAAPSRVLAHHWPAVPNHGDVTCVDWSAVEPVEILTGGYPCQPFSENGKREGVNDDRHLWPFVREAVRVLRPRLVVLENVAGHRSLGFDRVLGDMAEDGLHARWISVRASHAGAPHHRERLFIVASPADAEGLGWDEGLWRRRASEAKPGPRFREDVLPGWASRVGPEPSFADERGKLNPEYPEWMMGLPRGHVTSPEIGLSYREQIKALGNGVCPQQAALALQILCPL